MLNIISELLHASWIYSAFTGVALCSTLVIIIVILSENRNPVKSLAWVTVLLLLPVVGIILYLFFGRNIKNTRMISRRNRRRLRRREGRVDADPTDYDLSDNAIHLIRLGRALSGAQFYPDNQVEIFTRGAEKFQALADDLRAARHSINLQYYIFQDDDIGNAIADILIERARAGVKVRLIYDHVGSFSVRNRFYKKMQQAGIDAHPFFKVSFPLLGTRVNWRNHRKICIIDSHTGYIGGMNIADRYITGGKFPSWRDTHARVTGPVVAALNYSFAVDWNFMCGETLTDTPIPGEHPLPRPATPRVAAQLLTSGPTSQWSDITMALHKAIACARKRIFIQTPYFLPSETLLSALQAAALAHVDVRILIPRNSDSSLLTHASASYISECLRSGIKIYRYTAGMLHSKMIIIDDEIVTIGSTNFDFRSFEYNFEANLFFYSKQLAATAIQTYRNDLLHSERILPQQWRKRHITTRMAESILRLLSPVL